MRRNSIVLGMLVVAGIIACIEFTGIVNTVTRIFEYQGDALHSVSCKEQRLKCAHQAQKPADIRQCTEPCVEID